MDNEILNTSPVEIIVEANPDGIIQEPKGMERSRSFDFFKMPEFSNPEPRPKSKPKKKRKIYRI